MTEEVAIPPHEAARADVQHVGPRRPRRHTRVAIVGSGFSGLGAAIRLTQAGIDDLVVFERGDDVGGTWRVNRYPGAACDVPSRLYEFTFAPNPAWSTRYARRDEIWRYLRNCADRFDVHRHVCFGHDVRRAVWDDDEARWHIATSRGHHTADLLIVAVGALAEPAVPPLAGLNTFGGDVVHTAAWDDTTAVRGRRVAVVGTGASAVQLVPAIQPAVSHLTVFQRTPPWVLPRGDRALSPAFRRIARRVPALHRAARTALYGARELMGAPFRHRWMARPVEALALRHLRRQVDDPALRAAWTPRYDMGCKRVLLSDDWYPALQQPNVTVVDGALTQVRADAVFADDGVARPADLLVLATGFRATDSVFARRVSGRDGIALSDAWTPHMGAHLGTTVAGFPNLFVLLGPNTGLGHSSVVLMIEAQIAHMVAAVQYMHALGISAVEPYREAHDAFVAEVQRAMAGTVWTMGGCDSWYLDAGGRNTTLWPGSVRAFRRRVAPFDPTDYRVRRGDHAAAPSGAHARPSGLERARGAVARAIVPRVPPAAVRRVTGGSAAVDGARLDPASHLVLAARPPGYAGLTDGTPAEARARYRREVLSAAGRPTPVQSVRDMAIGGASGPLRARLYTSGDGHSAPLLLYLHGGGFALGDLDTHDEPCRLLCRHAGQHVLSVDYRLAPEHPFPAAADDTVAALRWAQSYARRCGLGGVALAGDSAGATLATVAAGRTADDRPPVADLLLYPATDRSRLYPSQTVFDGVFLSRADVERFSGWYTGPRDHPDVSPVRADLRGRAPAYVVTAHFDVLRDEGRAYAAALADAGVPVVHDHVADLAHGFMHLTDVSPAARRATVAVARRWRRLLGTRWSS